MTTYCAPCLADLALVREASTAVAGTASCMAHAVLLTYPNDDPQRRRQRLAQLRSTANEKLATAGAEEQVRLELLVEEYSLAAAMESLVPRRRPEEATGTSRSARKRRNRDRGRQPGGAVAEGAAAQAGEDALAQVGSPVAGPEAGDGQQAGGQQGEPQAGGQQGEPQAGGQQGEPQAGGQQGEPQAGGQQGEPQADSSAAAGEPTGASPAELAGGLANPGEKPSTQPVPGVPASPEPSAPAELSGGLAPDAVEPSGGAPEQTNSG